MKNTILKKILASFIDPKKSLQAKIPDPKKSFVIKNILVGPLIIFWLNLVKSSKHQCKKLNSEIHHFVEFPFYTLPFSLRVYQYIYIDIS